MRWVFERILGGHSMQITAQKQIFKSLSYHTLGLVNMAVKNMLKLVTGGVGSPIIICAEARHGP